MKSIFTIDEMIEFAKKVDNFVISGNYITGTLSDNKKITLGRYDLFWKDKWGRFIVLEQEHTLIDQYHLNPLHGKAYKILKQFDEEFSNREQIQHSS